jgi:tetratricopeptide (TPR) repeat protein
LDNAELNFYLGKSALEVGDFTIALAAFERVAMLEPNNVHNALELARTQYNAHLFLEAEEGFKTILQNPGLPKNVRLNVEYYLSAIAKQQERSFFFTTARAGFLYDSNVNFGSSNDTYDTYLPFLGKTVQPSTAVKSDTAHEETLSFTHLYDFGALGGAMMRNQVSVYNRSYIDEHNYNIAAFSYNPALVYNDQLSAYELIGGIDLLRLSGKNYYTAYSLQPKWMYSYMPSLRQTFALKLSRKNYVQSADTLLDSRSVEGNGALEYYLSPSSSLRGDLVASRQIKDSGNRNDVNYNEIGTNILYTNQLKPSTIVQVNVNVKKRSYDDYNTVFQSYQTDKTVYGSFNVIERLSDSISLELLGNYNHTDSTLSIYSFDKYTLSMSLSTRF